MLVPDGSVRLAKRQSSAVDQIRLLATVLLVAYHVIGMPGSGLHLANPHPLRLFADLLADFRMPAFALIAGLVYSLRPTSLGGFWQFFQGKLKRLAVPGLIAALVFQGTATVMDRSWSMPVTSLWQIIVYPYAHFWFLQSILILFLVIGAIDAATRHKAELPMLGVATLLSLSGLPVPSVMSMGNALQLAPFFLAGISYGRHQQWIHRHKEVITALAVALLAAWWALSLLAHAVDGHIAVGARQPYALMAGLSACLLLLFYLPYSAIAARLATVSFTVYLYHVLGTAGMRWILQSFGVDSLAIHVSLGIAAGIIVPVAIHAAASRWTITRQLILGCKPRPVERAAPAAPPIPVEQPKAHAVLASGRRQD